MFKNSKMYSQKRGKDSLFACKFKSKIHAHHYERRMKNRNCCYQVGVVLFWGWGSVGRGEEGDSVISGLVILFVLLMIDSSTQRLLNKKLVRYNTTFSRKSKQEIIAVIRSQEVFNEEMIRQRKDDSLRKLRVS